MQPEVLDSRCQITNACLLTEGEQADEYLLPKGIELMNHVDNTLAINQEVDAVKASRSGAIALVGIGCRFPGDANDPHSLWRNLSDGLDAISEVPEDRWHPGAHFHPKRGVSGKSATRWGGFVSDIAGFDADFFGISPREAELMDPQQRLLLEVCWEALEDAGAVPATLKHRPVGVFMGGFTLDYMLMQLGGAEYRSVEPHTATGSMMTLLANRLSYVFGFQGPSIALDTACSSSLVAVHLACNSLNAFESEIAVAGGVNALLGPAYTIAESRAGMLSPTGRSRAFDARADGYVRGEGAGIVVLKRLADAEAAGDHIYAVIRGTAVNQDGQSDGLTVPSGDAQQKLMRQACAKAGIAPCDIDYVEAHGTGTPVGDPIEANAIGSVISEGRDAGNPCLIGSIKTNFGHTEAAAGVAGLIKASLVLNHRQAPPHLHLASPNPKIDLAALKLKVVDVMTALPLRARDLVASVNSFGFGGTNAHVVLTESPKQALTAEYGAEQGLFCLTLSARHDASLAMLAGRYADAIDHGGALADDALNDIVWTAAMRREHHPHRAMLVAGDRAEMVETLRALANGEHAQTLIAGNVVAGAIGQGPVFVYSGMGPQWWGMGQALYREEPVFQASVDRLAAGFEAEAGWSIVDEMMAGQTHSKIARTDIAQPVNFIVQVALSELFGSWGVNPSAIVGHSAGEPAAAFVSGCLTEADAIRVVLHRSRLQHTTAGQGKMLAVGLSAEEALNAIAALNDPSLSLAAINSPSAVTVAGGVEGIERLRVSLEERGAFAKALRVDVPYHSIFMEPLQAPLHESLAGIAPRQARIPLYSTVTGSRVFGDELDAEYWYKNVRQPVLFLEAIQMLLNESHHCFVEIAPHPVLKGSIQESALAIGKEPLVIETLHRDRSEARQVRHTLGALYCAGLALPWETLLDAGRHVSLPKYAWRHETYWHESVLSKASRRNAPLHPILSSRADTQIPTWEVDLDRDTLSFLQDHCIEGSVVFPGAGYIEMALFAARSLFGDFAVVELKDVVFERALYLIPDAPSTLRISVDPATYCFSIASSSYGDAQSGWHTNCSGKMLTTNSGRRAKQDLNAMTERCGREIPVEECYLHFENMGLEYGPTFRGIAGLRQGHHEAVARVVVPEPLHHNFDQFCIHPALLDVCFQVLAAALPFDKDGSTVYMPTGVSEGRVMSRIPQEVWIHAALTAVDSGGLSGDIRMFDAAGELLLEILGCKARSLGGEKAAFTVRQQRLYRPDWLETARNDSEESAVPGQWIVYGGCRALANEIVAALKQAGNKATHIAADAFDVGSSDQWQAMIAAANINGALKGVIHLDACHDDRRADPDLNAINGILRASCIATLNLTKTLAALNTIDKPKLWIVTRGSQSVVAGDAPEPFSASVWGLARVLGHYEHIDLWGGIIDLSADRSADDAAMIVAECTAAQRDEDQIAFREGRRFCLRLADCTVESSLPVPPSLRSDASYLITGGLGALGIAISGWMVARGARHLVLLGRESLPLRGTWASLPADHPAYLKVAAVMALERMGASVVTESVDVSDRDALSALIGRLRDEGRPPLRGVIHSAGVAYPRLIAETDEKEFMSVFPSKVMGAWNLHHATAGIVLDFFVMFSSVASLVTSMGQGNYAAANTSLDMLSYLRRANGLPALSVNWGPWGDVGMATKLDLITYFNNRGFYPMTAEQGCQALGWLMSDKVAQAIVIGAHWTTVGDTSPLGIAAPMLRNLIAAEQNAISDLQSDAVKADVLFALRQEFDPDKRIEIIQEHVRALVCRVLRVDSAKIADADNLSNRGLDSMMAIEVKNRIEQSFKVAYAIIDLLKGASITTISAALYTSLGAEYSADTDDDLSGIIDEIEGLTEAEIETLLFDVV